MDRALEALIAEAGFMRRGVIKALALSVQRNLQPDEIVDETLVTLDGLAVLTNKGFIHTDSNHVDVFPYSAINTVNGDGSGFTVATSGATATVKPKRGKAGIAKHSGAQPFMNQLRNRI